jgi:thioredoxin-dependent peroxiredoxin
MVKQSIFQILKGKKLFYIFIQKTIHQAAPRRPAISGTTIIGVSIDGEKSHQKFISKHELPFQLLVDEDKSLVEAYGVWVEKNMYGKKYMGTARTTFVIDADGIIQHIIKKVDNKNASQQIRDLGI